MREFTFNITEDRADRLNNLLLQRGQSLEQFLEPWLADADTHMGHDPSDTPEDQEAAAQRFARKAQASVAEREEATAKRAEAENLAKLEVPETTTEGKDNGNKN